MRSLRVFPIFFAGIAGLLGGCPPPSVNALDPNSIFRGLTMERSPVEVGDEVGAIVSTVPLAAFSARVRGRIVVNFGDDKSMADQQADLLTGVVSGGSGGKYRVQAAGGGTVATRIAWRYGRAGTFTVSATVIKDVYGYGERVDGGATASITVLAASQPAPAPTPAPNPPAPTPTSAPAPATPTPVTPAPPTPAPATSAPTPTAKPAEPLESPTPTPVPPTPTPVPTPTFFDPPDPTPRPSETPGDFEDDPDATPRPN